MRKYIRRILLLGVAIISVSSVRAQVIVDTKLDRAQILIGEQAELTTTVSANARQRVEFPTYAASDTLTAGVEVVSCGSVDTTFLNDGKRLKLTRRYQITSFDSALYTLPRLEVLVDGKPYQSRTQLGLKVSTVPVDTVHVDQYAPPFTVTETPFVWQNRLLLLSFLPWIFVILLFLCAIRLTSKKPIVRKIRVKPPVPPYKQAQEALKDLYSIKCVTEEDNKLFYMRLTDVIRGYIQGRYGFYALEKPTSEILDGMTEFVDAAQLETLRSLFTLADRVKFAKASSSDMERKRSLEAVADFLEATRDPEMENVRPKVITVTLSGRKQRAARVALWCGFCLCLVCSVALLGWVGVQIYEVYL